jgi:hypothetical protein
LLEIENPKIDSPYYTDENMGYHGMLRWDDIVSDNMR